MTEAQIAWAAGLFEGEGTIAISGRTQRLSMAMTDRDVVERFAALVGCGTIRHVPRKNPLHNDCYSWHICRACHVIRILEAFLPYLGERRSLRALEVLAAARTRRSGLNADTCVRGHDLSDPSNVRVYRGARHCIECNKANQLRYRSGLHNG